MRGLEAGRVVRETRLVCFFVCWQTFFFNPDLLPRAPSTTMMHKAPVSAPLRIFHA